MLIALRKAADARFVLMGWAADDDWRAACEQAQAHELTLMQAYQQGNARCLRRPFAVPALGPQPKPTSGTRDGP